MDLDALSAEERWPWFWKLEAPFREKKEEEPELWDDFDLELDKGVLDQKVTMPGSRHGRGCYEQREYVFKWCVHQKKKKKGGGLTLFIFKKMSARYLILNNHSSFK